MNNQLIQLEGKHKPLQQSNYEKQLVIEQQSKDLQSLQSLQLEKSKSYLAIDFQVDLTKSEVKELQQANYQQTKIIEQQQGEVQSL